MCVFEKNDNDVISFKCQKFTVQSSCIFTLTEEPSFAKMINNNANVIVC